MKELPYYLRLFQEMSPYVGSLMKVRKGIRIALREFANEYQLEDDAKDSVSRALRENMRAAVISVAILTTGLRSSVDYNTFLVGGKNVPLNIFKALAKHHILDEQIKDNPPDTLDGEYCGKMVWRIADHRMTDSLNDLCAEAMKEEV